MTKALLVAIALLLSAGCEDSAPKGPRRMNQGNPIGSFDQQEVSSWLRDNLQLTNISLKNTGDKNYEGTGEKLNGHIYQLKVIQTPEHIDCDFTDPDGKKRSISASFNPGNRPAQ